MLSSNELSNMQNLISDETITFNELIEKFNSSFDKLLYFKICLVLDILIKDHQLNLFQEISAFFILHYINGLEIGCSLFSSLSIKILNETKNKAKKIILINLLMNNQINTQIKIADYIKMVEYSQNKINIDKEIKNVQGMLNMDIRDKKHLFLNPIISNKVTTDNRSTEPNNITGQIINKNKFNFVESPYMSYNPFKSKEIYQNEIKWILPNIKHNFIWENNCYDKIKYLLKQILEGGAVNSEDINYIISTINKKPNTIKNINFTPQMMMELIEKDETLSFEILSSICKISLNE